MNKRVRLFRNYYRIPKQWLIYWNKLCRSYLSKVRRKHQTKVSNSYYLRYFVELTKKNSDRIGIDFYIPGRSDDVSTTKRKTWREISFSCCLFLKDLGGNTIWEDSETKQFYEDIPDLKLFLPGYAFREPAPTTSATSISEGRILLEISRLAKEKNFFN